MTRYQNSGDQPDSSNRRSSKDHLEGGWGRPEQEAIRRIIGSHQVQPSRPVRNAGRVSAQSQRRSWLYNAAMPEGLFNEMKDHIDFSESDAQALSELSEPLRPHLPGLVDQFYSALNRHPDARAVLHSSPGRLDRLRHTLLVWLTDLFEGRYDEAYFQRRCNIGRTHVRVDLPQHFMFTAMNVIRLALLERIGQLRLPRAARAISALHKLLDLELAIMNQTYREDLVLKMQAIEHAEYEQKIGESEHLATIGQLAASLAHEIKNPLAGISGAIQVLGSDLSPDHPHKSIIEEALRQIDRLDAAVRDLLIYARPKPPETARINVSDVVLQTLTLMREEPAFRNVPINCDGVKNEHFALADEAQIQQVLTNVMLNAAHACEGGGEIQCEVTSLDSAVRIIVQDGGSGMSPEVLARAFEPFYTTKARGTGLGLSICKRIIETHKGVLDIDSRVGRGTRVTIEIPAAL